MSSAEKIEQHLLRELSKVNGYLGGYLRLGDNIYYVHAHNLETEDDDLLAAAGLTREIFSEQFRLGNADSRLFSIIDAEGYNAETRRIDSRVFKVETPTDDLMKRSTITLCGRSDLWETDNEEALRRSVELFRIVCPDYDISSAQTPWGNNSKTGK